VTEGDLDRLRGELSMMRYKLVESLVEKIDGGQMALLGSVGAALAAIDGLLDEQDGQAGCHE
jgi:hypothetical protein